MMSQSVRVTSTAKPFEYGLDGRQNDEWKNDGNPVVIDGVEEDLAISEYS